MASIKCVRPILTILSHSLGLGRELVVQPLERGDQVAGDGQRRRNVHRRRERVVRRLPHVDVVVRMDGAFLALRADAEPQPLVRQVGDHLVGVHVGRGAGAGLVDVDRKVVVVLAGGDFFDGGDDRLGEFLVELAELADWPRRRRPSDGRRRGSPRPARARARSGKLSTARAVDAPYSASAGTCISPIVSRSMRKSLMDMSNSASYRARSRRSYNTNCRASGMADRGAATADS